MRKTPSTTDPPAGLLDEPLERLEQRALDGVTFGIAALKRLRRRLPSWLRPDGKPDADRCVAVVAAVNTALATVSPLHLNELAKRVRNRRRVPLPQDDQTITN